MKKFNIFILIFLCLGFGCRRDDIPPTYDMGAISDLAQNGGVPDLNDVINDHLAPQPPLCDNDPSGTNSPNVPIQRNGSCIDFNMDFYKDSNSGAKMARAISSSKNRKQAFEKYFAPLAVYVQQKTGYPASALLTQWADETAWGTSKQVRVNNNIGGHSCFKFNPRYKYPIASRQPGPSYINPPVNVRCTYPRPIREGGFYMTFGNIVDASLSQVYNILHNPGTARNYAGARNEVRNAIQAGRKPNPARVINGLAGYAAFPPDYRARLITRMNNEGYQRYDDKTICGM